MVVYKSVELGVSGSNPVIPTNKKTGNPMGLLVSLCLKYS